MAKDAKTAAKKSPAERKKPVHVPGGERVTLHHSDGERRLQMILTPAKGKFFARAVLMTPNGQTNAKGKPAFDREVKANKSAATLEEAQAAYKQFINEAGEKGWSTANASAPLHDFNEIPA